MNNCQAMIFNELMGFAGIGTGPFFVALPLSFQLMGLCVEISSFP